MPEITGRLRTPRLAAAPSSPIVGEMYYDTVANTLYYWNGTAWQSAAKGEVGATVASAKAISSAFSFLGADSAHRTYTPAIGSKPWDQLGGCFGAVGTSLLFTAQAAGKYLIVLTVHQIANAGNIGLSAIVNDVTVHHGVGASNTVKGDGGETGGAQVSTALTLVAGDTVKLYAYHSAGGSCVLDIEAFWLDAPGSPGVVTTQIPLVTDLPASPVDGQEVYFLVSPTLGIFWHMRYRAASASAYKWEFLGGSPLYAAYDSVASAMAITSNAFIDAPDGNGPSLTVPRAGEYRAQFGARTQGATGGFGMIAPKFGAAATRDNDWALVNAGVDASIARIAAGTCVAGDAIKLQYRNFAGANPANFQVRWLSVQPVRLS
jgi:hypothetical protein